MHKIFFLEKVYEEICLLPKKVATISKEFWFTRRTAFFLPFKILLQYFIALLHFRILCDFTKFLSKNLKKLRKISIKYKTIKFYSQFFTRIFIAGARKSGKMSRKKLDFF
jgi:hypothetical protein